jgi:hypothetical protein
MGARHWNAKHWSSLNRMPRFYFDVREGAKFTPDDEGTEFDSLHGGRDLTGPAAEGRRP